MVSRLLGILAIGVVVSHICAASGEDEICVEHECYPRVFVPSEEFAIIRQGQEIPAGIPIKSIFDPGLHIRINLEVFYSTSAAKCQTGEKEAKLNDPNEESSLPTNVLALSPAEPESPPPREPSIQAYDSPPRLWHVTSTMSDAEAFTYAYSLLLTAHQDPADESLSFAIWNLESLAHDREFGIKLVQKEALEKLLLLTRTNAAWQIRRGSARVIGSALWNNGEAIEIAKGRGLLRGLLVILKQEKDFRVRGSLVFALSAATAGEDGVLELMHNGGSQLLRRVFSGGGDEVQGKCATFVQDNLLWNRGLSGVDEELLHWCEIFQETLLQSNPAEADKILTSLMYHVSHRG
jgi:nucleotide exchange factor SIL1